MYYSNIYTQYVGIPIYTYAYIHVSRGVLSGDIYVKAFDIYYIVDPNTGLEIEQNV